MKLDYIGKWIRKNASTILTVIGAAGMIATVVLAVKETPEAMTRMVQAQSEKGTDEELTVAETIKAEAPCYIPAAITGVCTLACFFSANALDRKRQGELMLALSMLEERFSEYRAKTIALYGKNADAWVRHKIEKDHEEQRAPVDISPDSLRTFYISEYGPKFFELTMEEVMDAEYQTNRMFILRGYVTLNEFFGLMGLDPVADEDLGWYAYEGETLYGYQWIDFENRLTHIDDIDVIEIVFPFGPHMPEPEYPLADEPESHEMECYPTE